MKPEYKKLTEYDALEEKKKYTMVVYLLCDVCDVKFSQEYYADDEMVFLLAGMQKDFEDTEQELIRLLKLHKKNGCAGERQYVSSHFSFN